MTEQYLTVDEAAETLGVKRRTVYKYIQEGKLPSFKAQVGRGVLVRASDVEALKLPLPREKQAS